MKRDELVKKLRGGCDANTAFLLCYEAADAIVALQARVAELDSALEKQTVALVNALAELAAARALLRDVHGWLDPWESRQSALRDRIDAALAGEKTP